MKRIIASLAVAAAFATVPAVASAQTFAPVGGSTITGDLVVNQYLSGTCAVTFNLGVSPDGSGAWIANANFGSGSPCSSISPDNLAWPVYYIGTTGSESELEINGLRVTTSAGWCEGNVRIKVDNTTGNVTIASQTIPGQIFGFVPANCTLNTPAGQPLTSSPPVSVS